MHGIKAFMAPYPHWFYVAAWTYLVVCFICSGIIIVDQLRYPRRMWVMNLVWPITALYFGPVALWLYYRTRPIAKKGAPMADEQRKKEAKKMPPTREQISTAVFHCGAGCTLGDIIGEGGLFLIGGAVFIAGSEFATKLFVDLLLAYVFGIFFQYFTIAPMRSLGFLEGVKAAVRADTISILAFEVGMFGWMAITRFVLFPGPRVHPNSAVFWFMMQIAMIVGWATAYPANIFLLSKGWKEKMPQYATKDIRAEHQIPSKAA